MSADPVQLLDRLSPPDGWSDRTDLDADPVAAAILERVLSDDGSNVVSLDAARRRRRRGIGGAIVVAALVAGGAVAAVLQRSPQETRQMACWSNAAFPPDDLIALSWDGQADPVSMCADQWTEGAFGAAAPDPELTACTTAEGIAAVMPGDIDVCDELGLAEFSPPPIDDQALAVNRAASALNRRFNAATCEPIAVAVRETPGILEEYGLSGWTVKIVDTFRDDETCATVTLEEGAVAEIASLPPPD